jgi:hypothetical protein
MTHIALHQSADPFSHLGTAPSGLEQIHRCQWNIEGKQALEAGLTQRSKAADQHTSLADRHLGSTAPASP